MRSPRTHCDRGHPLEGENILVYKDGHRRCRICKLEYQRRFRRQGSKPIRAISQGRVPSEPIYEAVMEWSRGNKLQAMSYISELTGLPFTLMDSLIRQRRLSVEFSAADKILCAINRTDVWHMELADYYEAEAA